MESRQISCLASARVAGPAASPSPVVWSLRGVAPLSAPGPCPHHLVCSPSRLVPLSLPLHPLWLPSVHVQLGLSLEFPSSRHHLHGRSQAPEFSMSSPELQNFPPASSSAPLCLQLAASSFQGLWGMGANWIPPTSGLLTEPGGMSPPPRLPSCPSTCHQCLLTRVGSPDTCRVPFHSILSRALVRPGPLFNPLHRLQLLTVTCEACRAWPHLLVPPPTAPPHPHYFSDTLGSAVLSQAENSAVLERETLSPS